MMSNKKSWSYETIIGHITKLIPLQRKLIYILFWSFLILGDSNIKDIKKCDFNLKKLETVKDTKKSSLKKNEVCSVAC